ncbi:DUF4260 domain-containing protein [Devosia sp. RR2S18]|uniref:DUF4260 domain-containing protein n=1 Tax=Devosia rhizosphaerae TaxID=3049774 RepID=UPI00253FE1F9|nr:DUF4260 domain-containing protein [Devosia sp. RR2S18]WIJ25326.1 DUF4260 domain-containing protein [Devosia sp. RR2S18]
MTNEASSISASLPALATGGVRTVLRLEGLAALIVATAAYFTNGGTLWLFAVLFFAPDISFAAYTVNSRAGAAAYNVAHSYVSAALLAGAGLLTGAELLVHLALILAAHIGFDRSLGYVLKYGTAFSHTHLGPIGKSR